MIVTILLFISLYNLIAYFTLKFIAFITIKRLLIKHSAQLQVESQLKQYCYRHLCSWIDESLGQMAHTGFGLQCFYVALLDGAAGASLNCRACVFNLIKYKDVLRMALVSRILICFTEKSMRLLLSCDFRIVLYL